MGVIRLVLLDDVIETAGFMVDVGKKSGSFLLLYRSTAGFRKARIRTESRDQPGVGIETVPVRENLIELLLRYGESSRLRGRRTGARRGNNEFFPF